MSRSGYVICRKNGSTAKNFTDGKKYWAMPGIGRLYTIIDDFGRHRYVIPGIVSPHLPEVVDRARHGLQRSVGVFEWAEPDVFFSGYEEGRKHK